MSKDILSVEIEKMVSDGHGLARTEGGVVFVEQACPGDICDVEVISHKRGVRFAKILKLTNPAKHRRDPACIHSEDCGGCDWLHIEYQQQLENKKTILEDCLQRIAKIKEHVEMQVFFAQEWHYRSRVQIKQDENGVVGFFKKKSHEVVEIKDCKVIHPSLNESFFKKGKLDSELQSKDIKAIVGDNDIIASQPKLSFSKEFTKIKLKNKNLYLRGCDFVQNNHFLLEKLVDWVCDHVDYSFFIDLYGGTGFFSLFLSTKCNKGILVESVAEQTERAKQNFKNNEIHNVDIVNKKVENWLPKQKKLKGSQTSIVLDPPRIGVDKKALSAIVNAKISQIVYVSCDPATLSRDLFYLLHNGYKIENCALFDLYPQTRHIESCIQLRYDDGN
jgi:23S rRNA (uracil1939-C5)-methyltransferase